MKIFFDTEFMEDGRTIELLSIGLVREDGATLYLENAEADRSHANDWVRENVLPKLTGAGVSRADIAAKVRAFAGEKPEFWAYYADYDWVVLCQLYGRMVDLPEGFPKYCRDFKQLLDERRARAKKPPGGAEHNALADALWLRDEWIALCAPPGPTKP